MADGAGGWARGQRDERGRALPSQEPQRSLLKTDSSSTLEEGARAGEEGYISTGMVGGEGRGGVLTGLIRDGFLEEVAFKLGSEDLKKGVCQTGWQVEGMLQAVGSGQPQRQKCGRLCILLEGP